MDGTTGSVQGREAAFREAGLAVRGCGWLWRWALCGVCGVCLWGWGVEGRRRAATHSCLSFPVPISPAACEEGQVSSEREEVGGAGKAWRRRQG